MQHGQGTFFIRIRSKTESSDSFRVPERLACKEMDIRRYLSSELIFSLFSEVRGRWVIWIIFYIYLYIGLLQRYPADLNITWTTVARNPITNDTFLRDMAGPDILSLLKKDYSIKVFEALNSRLKRENMSKRMSLRYKMDLFKDYSHPEPFPEDMFLRLPNGSPNQAYLMLGTKGTGE